MSEGFILFCQCIPILVIIIQQ